MISKVSILFICFKMTIFLFPFLLGFFTVSANLEGPFLLWGPTSLGRYRRPAITFLSEDDLTNMYSSQSAIVVFNNQDSVPLSSGYFPRLRKMLESRGSVMLSQDFLDVHPDYVSNDTSMVTLQGPWSDRDTQITETFERLQDIYGKGRVLGILGNSRSHQSVEPEDLSWSRSRRSAAEDRTTTSRTPDTYALYNATGLTGRGALIYSSGLPTLRWPNGSETILDNPVGLPTIKTSRLYTNYVVKFEQGSLRITLEFSFKVVAGWWTAVGVEVKQGLEADGLNLQAPQPPDALSAILGRSYHCSFSLDYTSNNATLIFPDIQLQPYMDGTGRFSEAFDCTGFMTVPIWSGLLVSFIIVVILTIAISMILDIKSTDKFESSKSKQLTITVFE